MLVTEDIYKNFSRKIVDSCLAELSKEEILLSSKLGNLHEQLGIFPPPPCTHSSMSLLSLAPFMLLITGLM